jgi:site-specific DNA-methyltransferase (adenine-specific)/adenine-specific DNA-methyltransferase
MAWPGRRPVSKPDVSETTLAVSEVYGASEASDPACRLIQGDNLEVMAALEPEYAGRFALIYLDPPFFTGAEWAARRGATGQIAAFSDSWDGDLGAYLQWILERVTLARELLADDGCLYMHLSWHVAHYVKVLLDEVFGVERFQNEIVWCYREAINSRKRWNRKHDTLLFYSKGADFTFNPDAVLTPYSESSVRKFRQRDERGPYRLMGRGIEGSPLRSKRDLAPEMETQFPDLTYRHYLGEGTLPVDYWLIDIENQASHARTGYPTQKPEALLERILLASSNEGDLIGDFCCGSGTTLAVAQRLGRRWVGCDTGALAIHTCRKRLLECPVAPHVSIERLMDEGPGRNETSLAMRESAEDCRDAASSIMWVSGPEGSRVRLNEAAIVTADMWAVEWVRAPADPATVKSAPFRPDWWSGRSRRKADVAHESDLWTVEDGALWGARVALYDAAGGVERALVRAPNRP